MKKRIAILFHEKERDRKLWRYAITYLAEIWRNEGFEVVCIYGLRKYIPADVAVLHISLSVVPEKYIRFAKRYPIVLNGEVRDIRKSTFSRNIVRRKDSYAGPVIIKSDLNYAGHPERRYLHRWLRRHTKLRSLMERLELVPCLSLCGIQSPLDYRIFESMKEVPEKLFQNPNLIIEKFLPEKEGEFYFVRTYLFLGDQATCSRLASKNPIVNDATCVSTEEIDPHPDIVKLRQQMKFDYGKFDYVIHDGVAILLDANKTVGASSVLTPELLESRRVRAAGIHCYL